MNDKMELEEAIQKLKLMEYKYTLTNNDDKAIEIVLEELNKYRIETASKIANRVNGMSTQEMQEFLKPYTLYEKIIETQNKKIEELKRNSIPKKKIENEIEALKAQCGGNVFHIQQTLNAEIRLLQKLLKDK